MSASAANPIYLLSGPPGAGKTSVARALAQCYSFGIHIPVDDLREWVVSGIAHPVPTWTEETTRQFTLARATAAQIARNYANAGFAAIIDDILFPQAVNDTILPLLNGLTVRKVLLLPPVDVILERNRTRTNKAFDTTFLNDTIIHLHREMSAADYSTDGWLILDTANLTLSQTVDIIFSSAAR